MPRIHIDFETYSECDLKVEGVHKYAAHPSTEILCMAWAVDDEEPQLWLPGQAWPSVLFEADVEIHAWNAAFERALLRLGTPLVRWHDTAALAACLALPRSLGECARVLNISQQKDTRGKYLIQRLCQPYRGERRRDPELLQELYAYCLQDVRTEREIARQIERYKPMNATERQVWLLDQRINDRGLKIDTARCEDALVLIDQTVDRLKAKAQEISGGVLADVGSRARVMAWAQSHGYTLEGYDKAAVLAALADPRLPAPVAEVLRIRQTLGKASTSKYTAMLNLAGDDDRARGLFWYHGAQTGRWAGRGFQPQNLPRPAFKDTDNCIELFRHRDADLLETLYGDPMAALSSCLRGMIVAEKGHRLLVSDFNAIEARVLSWLADETHVVGAFNLYDTFKLDENGNRIATGDPDDPWERCGPDIYCIAAAGIYQRAVTKRDKAERQIGKVAVLALGYGGGVGAFQTMAKAYGVKVEDDIADDIKVRWRKAHPKIVRFWYALEEAAMNAVRHKGHAFAAGPITFQCKGDFLFAKLPSGRRLAYFHPRLEDSRLTYWATDSRLGGRWGKVDTYGGKLAENVTQAVARDLLAEAMLRLEDAGYNVVASIHDEIICEMPKGEGQLAEMEEIMTVLPDWAEGLPMSAEGFECERYRK